MTDKITFNDLGLPEFILKAVSDLGFETPSPIQQACIPALLEGRDVLGMAQTGSGKTAAFSLPILAKIDPAAKALLRLTARQDISRSQTVSMTMTAQTDLLSLLSIISTQREVAKLLLDFIFLFL